MTRTLVLLLALVLALHPPALAESFQGHVVAISDGDTIRVLRGKEQIRVRLHWYRRPGQKGRCSEYGHGNMPASWHMKSWYGSKSKTWIATVGRAGWLFCRTVAI
jgi:hypothetical protein